MKRYYGFMFFSTVCFLFKSIKSVIQKIGKLKKIAGNLLDPPKTNGYFAKPKNSSKFLPMQEIRIWPNFKSKKLEQAFLSKF